MLEVKQLKVSYGRIPILHGVDFNVTEGEFIGILGHNGMGKTTLLKALIGLLKPVSGEIQLKNQNITRYPPHKRNRFGINQKPKS